MTLIPYRENGEVKYAPAPIAHPSLTSDGNYDSDNEPLIPLSLPSDLDEDALMRFTATGRPIAASKISSIYNLDPFYNAPQLLPTRYTDDSIIPAIVTDVIPAGYSASLECTSGGEMGQAQADGKKRRGSLLKKWKGEKAKKDRIMKVVYMPRIEYTRNFARDANGLYIGTEPHRRWTEEELDGKYAQYRPKVGKRGSI